MESCLVAVLEHVYTSVLHWNCRDRWGGGAGKVHRAGAPMRGALASLRCAPSGCGEI